MSSAPDSSESAANSEADRSNASSKVKDVSKEVPASLDPGHSPLLRNGIHLAVFLLIAVPLGAVADPRTGPANGRMIAAGILFLIAVFNIAILPRLHTGKQLARPDEGFVNGLWLYPLSLSLCFAIYPAFAAVGAWAALAAGDAAASFAGRHIASPKLPWNTKKSWAGFAGFILAAFPLCYGALYIIPCPLFLRAAGPPELPYVWTLAVLAAVCGAIVESLPLDLDDNVRVPLAVGAVLWGSAIFLSFATRRLPADTHVQPEQLLNALLINAVIAGAALLLKFSDLKGTLLGAALGTIIYLFAQWQGYVLFLLFAFGGSVLSKVGLQRKQALGAAEAREGKRGVSNVAANLLVPGLCCLAYPIYGGNGALLLAFAGALAAAFADTASSELGALSRAEPKLITTFEPVPHGTNGAVSLLGFVAAFGACSLLAAVAAYTDFYALLLTHKATATGQRVIFSAVLVAAGLVGTTVDSLLGATVEDRFPGIGKGAVNFACTLAGAVVAGVAFLAVA
jgi:uncharacterized protein (TIGR00297 family)